MIGEYFLELRFLTTQKSSGPLMVWSLSQRFRQNADALVELVLEHEVDTLAGELAAGVAEQVFEHGLPLVFG